MTVLILATVAWGTVAFGAVYPWAYWPLWSAATAIGLIAFWRARGEGGPIRPTGIAVAVLGVAAGVLCQLLPLPSDVLRTLSPATDTLLRQHDVSYALALQQAHALSVQPDATGRGLAALLALTLFALGTASVLSRTGVMPVARGVIALGAILALTGIIQKAAATERIYGFWQPTHQPYQIFGPFVNRNHFVGWVIMALSVAAGALCLRLTQAGGTRGDWRSRALWLASPEATELVLVAFAIVVMTCALVLTRSRSGLICFGATLLLAIWATLHGRTRQRDQRESSARRGVAAASLVALAFIALNWVGIDPLLNRFADGPDLSGRLEAWRAAIRIMREFPVAGTGLNTYATATLFYGPADAAVRWDAAHNDYLQLASEGGLLVGIPAAVAIIVVGYQIRRRFRAAEDDAATYWIRVGAVTGLVAIALQALVDFSLQIPGVAVLGALLCAIAIHVHRPSARRHSVPVAGRSRTRLA